MKLPLGRRYTMHLLGLLVRSSALSFVSGSPVDNGDDSLANIFHKHLPNYGR